MKTNNIKYRDALLLGLLVLLLVSCDLGLQEEWEYKKEPIGNFPTGMTALEWIRSINEDTTYNVNDSTGEFSYLLAAIERAGMEDEFDRPNDERTFFLLRNAAWNGGGQLLAHVAGSTDYPVDSISIERLSNILKYHILPDVAIDQGSSIPRSDAHFYYQTLIPGDTGIMEINRRLWNAEIRINLSIARIGSPSTPSNMPSSAKGAGVALHNYQFENGVGHQLNSYVRYKPF